jgi:ferredoxin-NADP reductase
VTAAPSVGPIDVRLDGIRYASRDVRFFDLADPSGRPLPVVPPGSHLELRLPNGAVRAYFIADQAPRGTYTIGVRRDPDGVASKYLHDRIRVGALLRIEAIRPRTLVVDERSNTTAPRKTIVVAEDVGIFRAWPIVRALDACGAAWELHYDAWSHEDGPLLSELQTFGSRVHVHVRRDAGGRPLAWDGIVACLDDDAFLDATGTPAAAAALARAIALDGRDLTPHIRWTNTVPERPRGPGAFDVVLAENNVTLVVHEGQTILDAITRAGIGVRYLCGIGMCGTCRTRVLAGTPIHRDSVLTERERASNTVMMICQSRAAAGERLVLDL